MLKLIKMLCKRKRYYKVTRTWYVWACSTTDAIEKTKFVNHDEVDSQRVKR